MLIGISSNIKKHYSNYCDFVDYYWINYFKKKKYQFVILPNSNQSTRRILNSFKNSLDIIILQGGNDIFDKKKEIINRNSIEKSIIDFGIKNKIPILGICRGMQLINIKFKGKIIRKKGHMRTKHIINFSKENLIKKKKVKVNSFHNFCITDSSLGKNLKVIARAHDDTIEFFKHTKYQIYGVMWHPERSKSTMLLDKLIHSCR